MSLNCAFFPPHWFSADSEFSLRYFKVLLLSVLLFHSESTSGLERHPRIRSGYLVHCHRRSYTLVCSHFLDSTYAWDQIVFVFLYLTYFTKCNILEIHPHCCSILRSDLFGDVPSGPERQVEGSLDCPPLHAHPLFLQTLHRSGAFVQRHEPSLTQLRHPKFGVYLRVCSCCIVWVWTSAQWHGSMIKVSCRVFSLPTTPSVSHPDIPPSPRTRGNRWSLHGRCRFAFPRMSYSM